MKKKLWLLLTVIPIIFFIIYSESYVQKKDHFTIGVASWGSSESYLENIRAFKNALNESGFIEGKNTDYILESAEINETKQRQIINDFVDKKVDLIYSLTTPGTLIAKNVTQNIPIVFSIVTYPVETGVINSLEHSGNNLVGTRNYIDVTTQLGIFLDIIPVKKIGFVHRGGEPNSVIQFHEMKKAGEETGVTVVEINPKNIGEVSEKIQDKINDVDAFYQACDTLMQNGGEKIVINMAMAHKKPTFSCNLEGVRKGALFGVVSNFSNIGDLAGRKAALVLSGAKPNEIFTETQRYGDIVVNTKTADYLGIKIPDYVMKVATGVFR